MRPDFCCREIQEVLMITIDCYRLFRSLQVMSLFHEGDNDGQYLFIVNVIISFGR